MSEKELESFATCIQEKILGLPNPDSADFCMPHSIAQNNRFPEVIGESAPVSRGGMHSQIIVFL
jgi:hypothetical protein